MSDLKNQYNKTQQLSEGVYVIEDGNRSWGGEVNHNFELLNALLSKKTLTLTYDGVVLGTYDTRLDSTIDIPKVETVNNKLTLRKNNEILGTFDNSEDTSINIPNFTLSIKCGDTVLGYFDNSRDREINIPNHSLSIKYGDEVLGTFDNSENLVVEIPKKALNGGTLTLALNGEEIGSFNANEEKTLDIVLNNATQQQIDDMFL
jgi:hypothetical protein